MEKATLEKNEPFRVNQIHILTHVTSANSILVYTKKHKKKNVAFLYLINQLACERLPSVLLIIICPLLSNDIVNDHLDTINHIIRVKEMH